MSAEKRWLIVESAAGLLIILLLVGGIAAKFTPLDNLPNTDSAVFLYIGRELVAGRLPYLDVWDHKGPMIYYLDGFGLWAGGGLWGVWALQFLLSTWALYAAYHAIRQTFGLVAAAVAVLIGSRVLSLFALGNLTEEYAVCFNLLALGAFFSLLEHPSNRFLLASTGAAFAASFLLRPNNAGFPAAIISCLIAENALSKDFPGLRRKLMWIAVGILVITLPILTHLLFSHALYEMYDQFVRYNLIYVSTYQGEGGVPWSVDAALAPFLLLGVLPGYILCLITVWRTRLTAPIGAPDKIALLLLIALPLEAFLINVSGRAFPHYYILWIPTIMLASAVLLGRIMRPAAFVGTSRYVLALLLIAVGWSARPSILHYAALGRQIVFDRAAGIEKRTVIIRYIQDHARPDQPVLFWGHGGSLVYSAQRESVTRFLYQQPLLLTGYATTAMFDEFRLDIVQENPPLIIEKKGHFIPLDPAELNSYTGYVPFAYRDIIQFVTDHYHTGFENDLYRVLEINAP